MLLENPFVICDDLMKDISLVFFAVTGASWVSTIIT